MLNALYGRFQPKYIYCVVLLYVHLEESTLAH